MKYKFITIDVVVDETQYDKPIHAIVNNKISDVIGYITYYPPWKQFVFNQAHEGVVFNNECLKNIVDYMENHIK